MSIAVINIEATGNNIRKLLYNHGISQRQLAESLGISAVAVSKWINGKGMPTVDNMVEIAHILQCSLDDIVVVDHID